MKWSKKYFFLFLVLLPVLFAQTPENITLEQIDSTTLHVKWDDVSDEAYFEVSLNVVTKHPTVGPIFYPVDKDQEEYTFFNLTCGYSYAVTVSAVIPPYTYASGNAIHYMSCDFVNSSTPQAPSNLTVTYSLDAALLKWNDNSDNEDAFWISKIWERPGMPSVRGWIKVPSNVTSYVDSAVQDGGMYSYTVLGYNEFGMGSPSNTVDYIHDAPLVLMGEVYHSMNVHLSWIDNSNFEKDGYVLYWSDGEGDFVAIYDDIEKNTIAVNFPCPSCGDNYFYLEARKTAYGDMNGKIIESVFSDTVMVTITDPSICGVSDVDDENVLHEFTLHQNYPNPFNPSTTISYSIPSHQYVRLVVYDVLGNEVKSLVDSYQEAGQHTVTLNLDNVSSGVYVYTLQGENQKILTKKMLFVK